MHPSDFNSNPAEGITPEWVLQVTDRSVAIACEVDAEFLYVRALRKEAYVTITVSPEGNSAMLFDEQNDGKYEYPTVMSALVALVALAKTS